MISTNDTVANPIDLLWWVLLRQSWGDNITGSSSTNALIRTGVYDGSFESASLDPVKAIKIRYQISDIESGYTDDLIKKICNQFSLIQYTDTDGYECVKYLFAEEDGVKLFTIDNNTEIDSFSPPDPATICINPSIKYAYDYATAAYTEELTINNVQIGTYTAAYTSGFTGSDGETFWNFCRGRLWPLVKHVEEMDTDLKENELICDYDGAIFRLTNIIRCMSINSFGFTVPFAEGKDSSAGDLIKVRFVHLSMAGTSEFNAVINSISLNKNANSCSLKVSILPTGISAVSSTSLQDGDTGATAHQDNDSTGAAYQDRGN